MDFMHEAELLVADTEELQYYIEKFMEKKKDIAGRAMKIRREMEEIVKWFPVFAPGYKEMMQWYMQVVACSKLCAEQEMDFSAN